MIEHHNENRKYYKYFYITHNPEETKSLGSNISRFLQKGDIVAFNGDLGAGKTCMIQGMITGINSKDWVSSPTFTLIKEYTGNIPVYHFDLYRLNKPEEIEELGYEDYFYGNGITLIEWAEKIREYLPENVLFIRIHMGNELYCRKIVFETQEKKYTKLMEELRFIENTRD